MKIAIRDDDTSYYTNVKDLESAFSGLERFPISLSIVPFSVSDHTGNHPYGNVEVSNKYADIAENKELVSYVKRGIQKGYFEIIQHGIYHEYKKTSQGEWLEETVYLEKEEMKCKIIEGKNHLEKVFNTKVNTFAAPSNAISPECAEIMDQIGMNVNCIVSRLMKRRITVHYLFNYLKSNVFKFFTGSRYSGILNYCHHQELNIYEFLSFDEAVKQYEECKKYNFPFIIFTHYWNLNVEEKKEKNLLNL